jgi:hypothetical protein
MAQESVDIYSEGLLWQPAGGLKPRTFPRHGYAMIMSASLLSALLPKKF